MQVRQTEQKCKYSFCLQLHFTKFLFIYFILKKVHYVPL